MRYDNPDDHDEVCCYGCSDYMTTMWATKVGDAWFCIPCRIDDIRYAKAHKAPYRSLTNREWTVAKMLSRRIDPKGL